MSGAAEGIAGLALSAVSVAALFTTCIECFDIVLAGKKLHSRCRGRDSGAAEMSSPTAITAPQDRIGCARISEHNQPGSQAPPFVVNSSRKRAGTIRTYRN
ncbi:hypothetical protein V8E51_007314 [Hyaloscypha variabilis]